MIETFRNCIYSTCSSVCESVRETKNQIKNTLNESIRLIASYNLKLITLTLASLAFAYFHDYNIILLYGFIGVVFHKQIDEITETVKAIFEAIYIKIKEPLSPLMGYKICNIKILNKPIQTLMGAGSILTFLYLLPISFLAAEFLCIVNCGANIAKSSLKIVKEYKERT